MTAYLADNGAIVALTIVYVLFTLYIGWYFKQKASSGVKEFYLAKREIPGWVISLAFFSTNLDAIARRIVGLVGADQATFGRPSPTARIGTGISLAG